MQGILVTLVRHMYCIVLAYSRHHNPWVNKFRKIKVTFCQQLTTYSW